MEYAKTKKELDERWRKRVKYQMLDLKHSMGNMKKARKSFIRGTHLQLKTQRTNKR